MKAGLSFISSIFILLYASLPAIAAWPHIIFPNDEGITLSKGCTYTIQWASVKVDPVEILLCKETGPAEIFCFYTIASAVQNSGSYEWTVPSSLSNGSDYLISVGQVGLSVATSNYPFTITDSLNVSWSVGEWGECSVKCGGGTQIRDVFCVDSSGSVFADSYCSGTKPSDEKQCNTVSCAADKWYFSGSIKALNDPNGVITDSGIDITVGDEFTLVWTYDPSIAPTVVTTQVAQWQAGSNRSSMIINIGGNIWTSESNNNDQVFDDGYRENIASNYWTAQGSSITTPIDPIISATETSTRWAVYAKGKDLLPDLSWPDTIVLEEWGVNSGHGGFEIYETGIDKNGQPYTLYINGELESMSKPFITGSVMNVHKPEGDFVTYLDVTIGNDFSGNLPDDIDTITVEAPSGPLAYTKADFTFYPQWKEFLLVVPGKPEIGEYKFTVTSGANTVTSTDFQGVNFEIPIPDNASRSPAHNSTVPTPTPTFSWGAVNLPGTDLYYRFEINNLSGNRVYATSRIKDMLSHTPPPGELVAGQTYKWRVRITDADSYVGSQNRSNSDWFKFTVEEQPNNGNDFKLVTTTYDYNTNTPNTLIEINPQNSQAMILGNVGVTQGIRDLDLNPITGRLYGIVYQERGPLNEIVEIDLVTGATNTVVFVHQDGISSSIWSLAFSPDGTLYGCSGAMQIGTIDLNTGNFKPVYSIPSDVSGAAIDFDPSGILYSVYYEPLKLISIDLETSSIIDEKTISYAAVDDIDYAPDGYIYHTNYSWTLFRINPEDGSQVAVGINEIGGIQGIASVPTEKKAVKAMPWIPFLLLGE